MVSVHSARCVRAARRLLLLALVACGDSGVGGDTDGIRGGALVFVVHAGDAEFAPAIVKSENSAQITLTLRNVGTKPHGFVVDDIDGSEIAPIAPGASAIVTFETPDEETIYTIRSTAPGDDLTGQWIVD